MFAVFCLMSLVLWLVIIVRSRFIKLAKEDDYWSIYDGVLFQDDDQSQPESVLGAGALHMRDSDIWSHYYRMYLIGENSISYPWYMPKDFPSDALNEIPKDRFMYFIKKE